MATIVTNSSYKVKVGTEDTTTLPDLVQEKGAIIFDDSDGLFKGSNGTVWLELSNLGVTLVFENGLVNTGGTVTLGGILNQDTTLDGDSNTYSFSLVDLSEYSVEVDTALTMALIGGGGTSSIGLTPTEMQVLDSLNSKGLIYADDYSGAWTDRSLIDKEYVDNSAAPYTFNNGLHETPVQHVKLGGTLTENTTIDGSAGAAFLNLEELASAILHVGAAVGTPNRSELDLTGSAINLIREPTATLKTELYLTNTDIGILFQDTALAKSIDLNGSTMLVLDEITTKGLEYAADYSAAWTDHSLVTKKWVEDEFLPIPDAVQLSGHHITNSYLKDIDHTPFEFFDNIIENYGTAFTVSIPGQSITVNEAGNYRSQFFYNEQILNQNDVRVVIRVKINGVDLDQTHYRTGDSGNSTIFADYIDMPGLVPGDVITSGWEFDKDSDNELHSTFTEIIKTT